jgi:opacity protein-like surface antigen
MKCHRVLAFLTLVLLVSPTLFAADFGVRLGRTNDSDANFVGAELLIDLGRMNLNPNIEYQLDDNITAGSGNIDVTFDLGTFGRVSPYVGAGVGLRYIDDEVGSTQTDLVGNVIGGLGFGLGSLKPYAQVKYFRVLDDDAGGSEDDVALAVGLRF